MALAIAIFIAVNQLFAGKIFYNKIPHIADRLEVFYSADECICFFGRAQSGIGCI